MIRRSLMSTALSTLVATTLMTQAGLAMAAPALPSSASAAASESEAASTETPNTASASEGAGGGAEASTAATEMERSFDAKIEETTEAPATLASSDESKAKESNSKTFTSDGQAFTVGDLGITVTPPAGWEVVQNSQGLSLIMQEAKDPTPSYDKAKYQRNITVAAVHKPSPIDDKRAEELKKQLANSFGKDGMASEFQVLEHKFFDYRGKNDGLLVYSTLKLGEESMMQAHVLLSGGEKQFLVTYTDLAERFQDQTDRGFELAWNSMVAIEVKGKSPERYENAIKYASFGGGVFMLLLTLLLLAKRQGRVDYNAEADAMDDGEGFTSDAAVSGAATSMMATLARGWRVDHSSAEIALSKAASKMTAAPVTRPTDYALSSF